jgi:hypothetical protein
MHATATLQCRRPQQRLAFEGWRGPIASHRPPPPLTSSRPPQAQVLFGMVGGIIAGVALGCTRVWNNKYKRLIAIYGAGVRGAAVSCQAPQPPSPCAEVQQRQLVGLLHNPVCLSAFWSSPSPFRLPCASKAAFAAC